MTRSIALALVALVVAAACVGDPAPQASTAPESPATAPDGPGVRTKEGERKRAPAAPRGPLTGDGGREQIGKDERRDSEGVAPGGPGGSAVPRPSGAKRSTGGGTTAPAVPAQGRYAYDQQGYEELCRATCDSSPLPSTQIQRMTHQRSSRNSTSVIARARISQDRSTTTTYRFEARRAAITRVHATFDYEGIYFESTYVPEPAIVALKLPMTVGRRWTGRWRDARGGVNGDYSVEVRSRETIDAGGSAVRAFRIVSHTEFSGEYTGDADITAWVDPASLVVVRTDGRLRLDSAFGRFRSVFTTQLRQGPGY